MLSFFYHYYFKWILAPERTAKLNHMENDSRPSHRRLSYDNQPIYTGEDDEKGDMDGCY